MDITMRKQLYYNHITLANFYSKRDSWGKFEGEDK
jgi:hypothetical protein